MSKMYLLEPRVSEEDRLWAEEHHEVKRLNEQIEKSKKAGKILACICLLILLSAMALLVYFLVDAIDNKERIINVIFCGIIALMLCILSVQLFGMAHGNKDLITQKNVYIETLVEERKLNQENNFSEGAKDE